MTGNRWHEIPMPSAADGRVWELFHENSKTSRYAGFLPDDVIYERTLRMSESLSFDLYPIIDLPSSRVDLRLSLEEAIVTRITARSMQRCPVTLEYIGTILYYACGITRGNEGSPFPRPFRTTPSGGALYPLEIFFHSMGSGDLDPGIYHYNPTQNNLRLINAGDLSPGIAEAMVQSSIVFESSLIIFITALFERSTFKYGDRGYRFVLLEAGHVAQNINLVSNALGLGCVNVGGYFDRQIDHLLGIDGVGHSTIYIIGIGKKDEELRLNAFVDGPSHAGLE
jgi:SagB-type dehydrogenase family enzyme